jgi:mono/diheme cytochrome c family protein
MSIPRPLLIGAGVFASLLIVPPFAIGWIRAQPSPGRPIHIFWDMDMQPKFKAQSPSNLFADTRSMRPLVPESVAVGEANLDGHLMEGVAADGQWATTLPMGLTPDIEFLKRGQNRFNIYCSVCHGYAGYGDGMVNRRAMELMVNQEGPPAGTSWVAAKSFHDETVRPQPIGQIFHTATHGVRTMAGYAAQVPTEDRWAIAAYVKALQLSQNATLQDVPPALRGELATRKPIPAPATAAPAPTTPPTNPPSKPANGANK